MPVFVRFAQCPCQIAASAWDAAKATPGVVSVLTGADVAAAGINGLPCGWLDHQHQWRVYEGAAAPVLALDTVRYVGDQVAMVVAETLQQARDATELVWRSVRGAACGGREQWPMRRAAKPGAVENTISPRQPLLPVGDSDKAAIR